MKPKRPSSGDPAGHARRGLPDHVIAYALIAAAALVGLLIVLNGREPYGGLPEP